MVIVANTPIQQRDSFFQSVDIAATVKPQSAALRLTTAKNGEKIDWQAPSGDMSPRDSIDAHAFNASLLTRATFLQLDQQSHAVNRVWISRAVSGHTSASAADSDGRR